MEYEKVSVNVDDRKLSQIDLLVEKGFYANRSDFINLAVQKLLDEEAVTVAKLLNQDATDAAVINDNVWFIGISGFDRAYLTRVKALGKKINVKGFGVLAFGKDCDDDLIFETVASVSKKITLNASDPVKRHFGR